MKTENVFFRATVPEELLNAFLQHVRDFDTQHPGCHFKICADMPDVPMEEMIARLRVEPALKFVDFFQRHCCEKFNGASFLREGVRICRYCQKPVMEHDL